MIASPHSPRLRSAGLALALTLAGLIVARYREGIRARFVAVFSGVLGPANPFEPAVVVSHSFTPALVASPAIAHALASPAIAHASVAFPTLKPSSVASSAIAHASVAFPTLKPSSVASSAFVSAETSQLQVGASPRFGRLQSRVAWGPIAVVAYLAILAVSEVAVTFGNPLLVFPLHGGIIILAALHLAGLESRSSPRARTQRLTPFLLAFIAIALIRIISLTLPLASIAPAYRFAFAGIPMTVGALLAARAAHLSWRDIGLVWRAWRLQILVIVVSVALGFIEYAILRPAALGAFPWTATGVVPALVVGLGTGFPEELIFRGVLQTATRPILGRWNWVYVSLVFAVLHIGYQSGPDLVFVFGVGLLYGWIFERTRSIAGTSIGHGLANVVLFFVAANVVA